MRILHCTVSVSLLVAGGIVGGVAGQTDLVLPSAFATQMGATANRFPHSRQEIRYQQVFSGAEINAAGGFVMKELCLREDEQFVGAAHTYDYTIRLGPTDRDATNLGLDFAANFSAPPTTVFSGSYSLPATAGTGTVDSWLPPIVFDTPYVHAPGSGNLLIEWINNSTTSSTSFLDFCLEESGCTTAQCYALDPTAETATTRYFGRGLIMKFNGQRCGTFSSYGTGLAGSGDLIPAIDGSGCATPGQRFRVSISNVLGGTAGCLLFGVAETSLPLLGGTVLVDPLLCQGHSIGGSGNGGGSVSFGLRVPNRPFYAGVDFFFQAVYVDAEAVAGVSFTPGLKMAVDQ